MNNMAVILSGWEAIQIMSKQYMMLLYSMAEQVPIYVVTLQYYSAAITVPIKFQSNGIIVILISFPEE